jgi:ferric-dicitrate binding protein FerR (iron transport regulator)
MPNGAANFTSGGASAIATSSGKAARIGQRAAAHVAETGGRTSRALVDGGKAGLNLRSEIAASLPGIHRRECAATLQLQPGGECLGTRNIGAKIPP